MAAKKSSRYPILAACKKPLFGRLNKSDLTRAFPVHSRRANLCLPEENMQVNAVPADGPGQLADDILEGADAIAEFLFKSKDARRRIYYLAESSKLPIFRLGSTLCARKSVLLNYITGQENRVLRA
jgi:hypothetical protein